MTTIDAVLLDLDDTICEYRRSPESVLATAFDRAGVDPFFDVEQYYRRYVEFTDAGEDIQSIREACFRALASETGHDPAVGLAVADAYTAERDHSDVRFLPGARQAIDALDRDYPLALVTNGDRDMQTPKLDALDIADRFETIVYAGSDTPAKPEPEPFHVALDAIGVAPERAVHVGNSLLSDVAGAHAAGLQSAWLDDGSEHDYEPTYVIDSMARLVDPPWRAEHA